MIKSLNIDQVIAGIKETDPEFEKGLRDGSEQIRSSYSNGKIVLNPYLIKSEWDLYTEITKQLLNHFYGESSQSAVERTVEDLEVWEYLKERFNDIVTKEILHKYVKHFS
jgi:hypothetical protein